MWLHICCILRRDTPVSSQAHFLPRLLCRVRSDGGNQRQNALARQKQQREQHRAVIILWCCRYIVAFVQESITLSICTCLGIHRRLRPMPSLHGINLLSFISNWLLCWKMAYPFSYTESYYTASAKSLMRIRMFCNKDRRYRHVIWPTKKRKANQWRLSYTLLNTGEWPKERNLERRERQSFIFCH